MVGGTEFGVVIDIFFTAHFFQFAEEGLEDVGGVVGGLFAEVGEAFGVLDEGAGTLEAHAGVDVLGGEVAEGAVGFGIVLNEDEVPDFDTEIGIHVDEATAGVTLGGHVDMEFGAGAAGAGLAHHPEVVFDVAVNDVDLRVEAFGFEELGPDVVGLLVEFGGVACGGCVDGGVETFGRAAPSFHDEFPAPLDGFALEVVAKGPVPEHFEKGVVVGVIADILEVVVFSTGADAFLGVGSAGR